MNENSPFYELLPAMQSAIEYSSRNVLCQAVRKAAKLGKKRVICRVNTPDKVPAMYIHDIFPKMVIGTRTFIMVDGAEGYGLVTASKNPDTGKMYLSVLHSHAINRYIERRHYTGTVEEAQLHIINGIMVNVSAEDLLNETQYLYFDGGTFLCNLKDGIHHIRTFVMNRQLYPAQRMRSLKSEKETDTLKRQYSFFMP